MMDMKTEQIAEGWKRKRESFHVNNDDCGVTTQCIGNKSMVKHWNNFYIMQLYVATEQKDDDDLCAIRSHPSESFLHENQSVVCLFEVHSINIPNLHTYTLFKVFVLQRNMGWKYDKWIGWKFSEIKRLKIQLCTLFERTNEQVS